jgi:precorrin-6Y C5,15-methyltransferase (decarboxylating)
VFVGGSGGELPRILQAVYDANPRARVCVSAIALETLHTALETLTALDCETEITQIAISRGKPVGTLHLLTAQNPVFLITGVRP